MDWRLVVIPDTPGSGSCGFVVVVLKPSCGSAAPDSTGGNCVGGGAMATVPCSAALNRPSLTGSSHGVLCMARMLRALSRRASSLGNTPPVRYSSRFTNSANPFSSCLELRILPREGTGACDGAAAVVVLDWALFCGGGNTAALGTSPSAIGGGVYLLPRPGPESLGKIPTSRLKRSSHSG